jgi:multiphosphoryl transfer protein
MITINSSNIKLNVKAIDKAEAITQAGTLLVENGIMESGYITSMMEREKVANTYLGNGIAIPHGLPKDRDLILQTGISVVQIPNGVEWNTGEQVYLVVGIAAKSDEHLEILSNLTHVLGDEELVQRLSQTQNADDIAASLTGRSPRPAATEPADDLDQYFDIAIPGKSGLHARPATALASLAKEFTAEIRVRHGAETANAKSLLALLKLGVEGGATVRVMAQGTDAKEALEALKQAIASGLDDEAEAPLVVSTGQNIAFESDSIPGISASSGLAIAPIFQFKRGKLVFEATAKDPSVEVLKLRQAIAASKLQLQDLHAEVKAKSGSGQAAIFLAHQEFLEDPELQEDAIVRLSVPLQNTYPSAAAAWQQVYEQRAAALSQLPEPLLAGRAADLRDVGQRVLRLLSDKVEEAPSLPSTPVILIAEDLTPSDTAGLNPALIVGFCTAYGGATSHSAIIARSLNIPAIVGAGPAILNLPDGALSILDSQSGNLYPHPSPNDIETAVAAQKNLQAVRDAEQLACYQPALMTDGHRVEVVANIGGLPEAEQAVNAGAEGIGLLRTEFLFLQRSHPPSEEEQFATYQKMMQALNGLPLIVRTLDIGGDKAVPYLNLPREENPFLGVRGIRLCFQYSDLFKTQLRAIFRASQTSDVKGAIKMMFPMIATLEDLRSAKAIAEEIRLEIRAAPIEIGMMIEVPSAALLAAEFAPEIDFFSIGTNDLTQYALAMDRGHPALAKQADGLHPAVLRLIDQTIQAANAAGKWVGVCGGIAGEPQGAAILVGLGATELSVSIPSVAAVKAQLRTLSFAQTQDLAQQSLKCRTAQEVRSLALPKPA